VLSNQNNVVFSGSKVLNFSIIIPTYNESANIIRLISEIEKNVPGLESTEIIVVDDNSPDGTGNIVENYVKSKALGKNEKTLQR
jgi:dolichol-phosphate mannosyltransferase